MTSRFFRSRDELFRAYHPVVERLEDRTVPTRFAVIGDYGMDNSGEQATANLVKSWSPEFVTTVGDNNYPDGAASTIDKNIGKYFHQYIYPYKGSYGSGASTNEFWPTLGNHDWSSQGYKPYTDYFVLPNNERYYTFTRGPVQFFMVNSDDHEPDGMSSTSKQATWVKNALQTSTAPWKLVLFHHTPYSSSGGGSSSMRWPFQQWGASAVLAGHVHDYYRTIVNGLPYFTEGTGGSGAAMRVDASDTQITFTQIRSSGSVVDSYTINKSGSTTTTVSIAATDASASESGPDTGTFTISRTGSTSSSLTVGYTVGGTATNGTDYNSLSGTVTIPSGSASTTVKVTPVNDSLGEGLEIVALTLKSGSGYSVGLPPSATVTIADNDGTASSSLVPAGSVWKYLDNGTNQGTAWRAGGFNDSAWKSGPAQLGYGDGDEATVVSYGSNSSNKYITTYFRRTFGVPDGSSVTGLTLRLRHDDGAVVYLNGSEVYRSNMPTGTIGYTTLASTTCSDDGATWFQTTVDPRLLLSGSNVLAVEIHQASGSSSDISFDFELTGQTSAASTSATAQPKKLSLKNADSLTAAPTASVDTTSGPVAQPPSTQPTVARATDTPFDSRPAWKKVLDQTFTLPGVSRKASAETPSLADLIPQAYETPDVVIGTRWR